MNNFDIPEFLTLLHSCSFILFQPFVLVHKYSIRACIALSVQSLQRLLKLQNLNSLPEKTKLSKIQVLNTVRGFQITVLQT